MHAYRSDDATTEVRIWVRALVRADSRWIACRDQQRATRIFPESNLIRSHLAFGTLHARAQALTASLFPPCRRRFRKCSSSSSGPRPGKDVDNIACCRLSHE